MSRVDIIKNEESKSSKRRNLVTEPVEWAGHITRMKDEGLPRRAQTKKRGGCRKRG